MVHCLWQKFSHCPNSPQTNSILFLTSPYFWTSMFFPHCPILARILLSQFKQNCPPQTSPTIPSISDYLPDQIMSIIPQHPLGDHLGLPSARILLDHSSQNLPTLDISSQKFSIHWSPSCSLATNSHPLLLYSELHQSPTLRPPLKWSLHQQPWPLPFEQRFTVL